VSQGQAAALPLLRRRHRLILDVMFSLLQIVTALLIAVAMALSLAHALELPGKMQLTKDAYYVVQAIYYPGFTIGGIGEAGGLIFTVILLLMTPFGSKGFWLTCLALLGLIGMQATYWLVTHPVNKFWLADTKLSKVGSGFFSFGAGQTTEGPVKWTELRDRWEYSHVARAGFACFSLIALLIALCCDH
jgi:hypothetical protein